MKKLFTFTFSILLALAAAAQNFSLSADVYLTGSPMEFEHVGHGIIQNDEQSSTTFTWKRIVVNTPGAWSNAICDNNSCWGEEVGTKQVTLAAGASGILDLHFYPKSTSGTGRVALAVWVDNDSLNADTIYYNLTTWGVKVNTVKKEEKMVVYPNPAKSNITLSFETSETVKVEIYDVLGKVIKTTTHNNKTSVINIEDLPSGLYIMRVYEKGTTYSKSFKKIQ